MKSEWSIRLAVLSLGLALSTLAGAQVSQAVELPKEIRFIVGTGAGGGFDQYARLLAKYMETDFVEKPTVIIQNMPGAGGIRSLSWLASVAPKDGSTIATMSSSAVFAPLLGQRGATYDAKGFNYLISLDRLNNFLLVWHTTPFTSADDAFTKEIIIGNSSGPSAMMPMMYNRLLGTKFKVVKGYRGTNDTLLAVERGEAQGAFNLSWSSIVSHPRLLPDKLIRILLQLTFSPVDDSRLADVPTLNKYVKDGPDKDMLEILLAKDEMGRTIIAPQDMPRAVVREYRDRLMKMVKSDKFVAEAKAHQMPLSIIGGDDLDSYVKRMYGKPQATIKRLREEIALATQHIKDEKE
jgi:tripartite-type tricarboxylate transporter receptor subunit TctC